MAIKYGLLTKYVDMYGNVFEEVSNAPRYTSLKPIWQTPDGSWNTLVRYYTPDKYYPNVENSNFGGCTGSYEFIVEKAKCQLQADFRSIASLIDLRDADKASLIWYIL